MRINTQNLSIQASAAETLRWAMDPAKRWPCSQLAGRRLFVAFAGNGDLVDMALDGGRGEQDCPAHELNAFVKDSIAARPRRIRERFAHCLR